MLGLRMQIHLQISHRVAAIGQKRHLLVRLHALGPEDFEEAPFGFGVVRMDRPKAFRGAFCRDTLPRDHFKPPGLAALLIPRVHIAPSKPTVRGASGAGKSSHSAGHLSTNITCSSPNSCSTRSATRRRCRWTVVALSWAPIGKISPRTSTVTP